MPDRKKKLGEADLMQMFLASSGLKARVIEHRDRPDFLVEVAGRIVGVEVCELFQEAEHPASSAQAIESVADRVLARAQHIFTELGGPSVRVSVSFANGFENQGLRRDEVADLLVEIVRDATSSGAYRFEWRPTESDLVSGRFSFNFVFVLRQPPQIQPHWIHVQAGWVAPLKLEHVQALVDTKATKLDDYRKVAHEIWLLIGMRGRRPSQFFEVTSDFRPERVRSTFDRTFLYIGLEGRSQELGAGRDA